MQTLGLFPKHNGSILIHCLPVLHGWAALSCYKLLYYILKELLVHTFIFYLNDLNPGDKTKNKIRLFILLPNDWWCVIRILTINRLSSSVFFSEKKNVFFNSTNVLCFIYELVTVQSARVIKMKKLHTQGALTLKL